MDKLIVPTNNKSTIDDELHYFASVICQTALDLEKHCKKSRYLKNTICKEENFIVLMNMVAKWSNLFIKEKGKLK